MTSAVLATLGLLLIGFVLRATVRPLQLLFVPASVVGGLVGLVAIQAALAGAGPADAPRSPATLDAVTALARTLRSWPGPLIAVVFAGLLLERPNRRLADSLRGAALAGIMVWIIVLGQVALGLAATWLVLVPLGDVPPVFGQLIEAGFAGGHGTAAALGAMYETELVDFAPGRDLAMFVATFGLVYSVISGIFLVNLGVRRGWTRSGRADLRVIRGLESRRDPPPMAFARVRGEVVDPLAFQILILALAFAVGAALQWGVAAAGGAFLPERAAGALANLPLFLFTLIGGLLVRRTMTRLDLDDLIDGESIKRLVAIAMELLIVAAIASLRIETVGSFAAPLALLLALGCVWTGACLLLSRYLLPAAYWFELAILNYGMSTGTTAQGMMLLRIVDPDLESGAAEDYALAAPLSAPFIGGGVLTLALPLVLGNVRLPLVVGGLVIVIVGLVALGRRVNVRPRIDASPAGP